MSNGGKGGYRVTGWLKNQQVRSRHTDPAPGTSWFERLATEARQKEVAERSKRRKK